VNTAPERGYFRHFNAVTEVCNKETKTHAIEPVIYYYCYCQHALADDSKHIEILEKMIEVSSTVLHALPSFSL